MLAVVTVEATDLEQDAATRYAATLADFARRHEIAVVYGEPAHPNGHLSARTLIAAMRSTLANCRVVGLLIDPAGPSGDRDTAGLIQELVEIGAVPVVVVAAGDLASTAATVRARLHADRIFRLTAASHAALGAPAARAKARQGRGLSVLSVDHLVPEREE